MASIDISPVAPASRGFLERLVSRLAEIASTYAVAQSRADQVALLNAKSDAELARMGLRREDIARHVFRDILYI